MPEIIPAVIPKSLSDLSEKLSAVKGLAEWIQIDILDGSLVPEKSWPYQTSGEVARDFSKIIREEEGLPFWEDFKFEVDLMVKDPKNILGHWIAAGAERVVVHFESFADVADAENFLNYFDETFGNRGSLIETAIGMAFNIETRNEELIRIIEKVDFVQFMGIAEIGRQGEPFDDRVLDKIRNLKISSPEKQIAVDGGVNLISAGALVEAGADRLVVGSAIFGSDDIPATIRELKAIG